MYSNMLSKFNVFEHDGSMDIIKHKAFLKKKEVRKEKAWGQQVKYKKF